MLDVLLALKWVKKYIKYFGGNPNRITVAGQSSGGAMVSSMLVSPLVPSNLFQQMIIHSGTIFASWSWSLDPVANAKDIALRANVSENATIHEINEAFMKMDVYDLMRATNEHYVIELNFHTDFIQILCCFSMVIFNFSSECWYCSRSKHGWWSPADGRWTVKLSAIQTKRAMSNGILQKECPTPCWGCQK